MRVVTAMCDYDCRESSENEGIRFELRGFGFGTDLIVSYYVRFIEKGFPIFQTTVQKS